MPQCNALKSCHTQKFVEGPCPGCGTGPCSVFPSKEEKPRISRPLRTLVLSPFAGDYERNKAYAQAAMVDSLRRGEAPFLSHLLYPQVLIDGIPAEREMGLRCEHSWLVVAEQCVLYVDLGISPGMHRAIAAWRDIVRDMPMPSQVRKLGYPWSGENEL